MVVDAWQPPLIALIGFGMCREDLGRTAEKWVARAEVLVGGRRMLAAFPEHPGERMVIGSPLGALLDDVADISRRQRVAVLAAGDPLFFGIGRRLVDRVGAQRLMVVPNVTAVQSLFARLAIPWDGVRVHSVHGRDNGRWLDDLAKGRCVVLLTDPRHHPAWVARKVMQAGLAVGEVVVGENLGSQAERVLRMDLGTVAERDFEALNVTVLFPRGGASEDKDATAPTELPVMGIDDEMFRHGRGLITKVEIRAIVLARLQLRCRQVLWDLGAGSGSVAIEAARMAALSRVAAVEKDEGRYRDLESNIRRFGCHNVRAYHGYAEDVVERLPSPDRVFIGGGSGNLEDLLAKVRCRLKPGGRVVQTAVTFDTLERVRSFWQDCGRPVDIVEAQISRSVPILNTQRLEALNPIFITSVTMP